MRAHLVVVCSMSRLGLGLEPGAGPVAAGAGQRAGGDDRDAAGAVVQERTVEEGVVGGGGGEDIGQELRIGGPSGSPVEITGTVVTCSRVVVGGGVVEEAGGDVVNNGEVGGLNRYVRDISDSLVPGLRLDNNKPCLDQSSRRYVEDALHREVPSPSRGH